MTLVPPDDDGQRLDRWLKKTFPDLGFGALQKLLRTGQIRIDGKRAKPDTRLSAGQDIRLPPQLSIPELTQRRTDEKDESFMRGLVIYEDDALLAINKPSGLAVQGGSGITRHVDGLLDYLADANGVRPRLVHRLDKETSGVLLLARSARAARRLAESFSGRDVEKIYNAIVTPAPADEEGRIDAPLAKGLSGEDMEKMRLDEDAGKPAITDYRVLARAPENKAALLECRPLTGRTHQIRVHAALIGCPLWGDVKYGGAKGPHFYLHAGELRLNHPETNRPLAIKAPLSANFKDRCADLGIPAPAIHKPA